MIKCKCWGCSWKCGTPGRRVGGGGRGGGGGGGVLGLLLEVFSFTTAPPPWVNLLSFLMTLQNFDCCCHFFSATCFLHTSEAKWWVAFTQRIWAGFDLCCVISLQLFCDLTCNLEMMKFWSAYFFNNICLKKKKKCNSSDAWSSIYLNCKIFIWCYFEKMGCFFSDRVWCFEGVCSRCGFASKMEEALFVLQTCSERIPWGGLSCANLFHNDWNVTETWTWNFIGQLHPFHVTAEKLLGYMHIELPKWHEYFFQRLV